MLVAWLPKSTDTSVASVRFRCLTPLNTLKRSGFAAEIFDSQREKKYDVLVISKRYDREALELAKRFQKRNQAVILDLSDNHFYNPKGIPAYLKAAEDLDAILQNVDLVTVCSSYLGNIVRDRLKRSIPVVLVEDAVEALDLVRSSTRLTATDPLKLLWFGSHGSPNADVGIRDLTRLKAHLSDVDLPDGTYLTVLSNSEIEFDKYKHSFGIPARYVEWDHERFCDLLSSVDAIVIPIGANPFSKSKSNNRLATALWYGIPVIADKIPAYEPFNEFAYLDDWHDGFEEVISGGESLIQRIRHGKIFAQSKCSDQIIAEQWKKAFNSAYNLKHQKSDEKFEKKKNAGLRPGQSKSPKKPSKLNPAVSKKIWPESEAETLKTLPLRSCAIGQPFDRLIARLRIERGQYESGLLPRSFSLGVVFAFQSDSERDLRNAIASVRSQSSNNALPIIHVNSSELATKIDKSLTRLGASHVELVQTQDEMLAALASVEFSAFLEQTDTLDPSAAAMISVHSRNNDLVAFGSIEHDSKKCIRNRMPQSVDGISHDHAPVFGNAFAISTHLVQQYQGDLLRELHINRLHLFQMWVRHTRRCRMSVHPEFLLFKSVAKRDTPNWFSDYRDAYHAVCRESFDLNFCLHPSGAESPYHLVPNRFVSAVSIIIAFRDKAEMTLAAIESIYASKSELEVQIVLIDNQSSSESMEQLKSELSKRGDRDIDFVSYAYPFNHSAQMNLGVSKAKHPVVLFMNNDCTIESEYILDELSAWAMHPGIGTVGAKIQNPENATVSAGIAVRDTVNSPYDSPVEDHTVVEALSFTRRVFGNSFAFCAISKAKYIDLGGLDEVMYPVGYNDVDFAARAVRAGLTSVSLGHHSVTHPPGQSRSKTDETAQKLMLHATYGSVFSEYKEDFRHDPKLIGRTVFEARS